MKQHQALVRRLVKPGFKIYQEITPGQCELLHMAVGISGEAGELLDTVKKNVIYQKPLDKLNIIEELGDLEFFMEGMRQLLDLNREDILKANIDKLNLRYSEGKYSNKQAQLRKDKQ